MDIGLVTFSIFEVLVTVSFLPKLGLLVVGGFALFKGFGDFAVEFLGVVILGFGVVLTLVAGFF